MEIRFLHPNQMNLVLAILIVLVLVIIIIVCAVYITRAAALMRVDNDPDQETAHRYLTVGSTIAWISVVLLIVAGGVFAYYGSAEAVISGKGQMIANVLLVVCGIIFVFNGIIAAIAASYLHKGKDFAYNTPYWRWCRNIAIFCLGAAGALLIIVIAKAVSDSARKRKLQEAQVAAQLAAIEASKPKPKPVAVALPPAAVAVTTKPAAAHPVAAHPVAASHQTVKIHQTLPPQATKTAAVVAPKLPVAPASTAAVVVTPVDATSVLPTGPPVKAAPAGGVVPPGGIVPIPLSGKVEAAASALQAELTPSRIEELKQAYAAIQKYGPDLLRAASAIG